MKLKLAIFATAFFAVPAAAQTTNCTRMGDTIHCETNNSSNELQGSVDKAMQGLVNSVAPPPAYPNPAYPTAPVNDPARAEERRKEVYLQVGELISRGDCDGAKRLAAFYGQPVLIRDTERACTKP